MPQYIRARGQTAPLTYTNSTAAPLDYYYSTGACPFSPTHSAFMVCPGCDALSRSAAHIDCLVGASPTLCELTVVGRMCIMHFGSILVSSCLYLYTYHKRPALALRPAMKDTSIGTC